LFHQSTLSQDRPFVRYRITKISLRPQEDTALPGGNTPKRTAAQADTAVQFRPNGKPVVVIIGLIHDEPVQQFPDVLPGAFFINAQCRSQPFGVSEREVPTNEDPLVTLHQARQFCPQINNSGFPGAEIPGCYPSKALPLPYPNGVAGWFGWAGLCARAPIYSDKIIK